MIVTVILYSSYADMRGRINSLGTRKYSLPIGTLGVNHPFKSIAVTRQAGVILDRAGTVSHARLDFNPTEFCIGFEVPRTLIAGSSFFLAEHAIENGWKWFIADEPVVPVVRPIVSEPAPTIDFPAIPRCTCGVQLYLPGRRCDDHCDLVRRGVPEIMRGQGTIRDNDAGFAAAHRARYYADPQGFQIGKMGPILLDADSPE